MKKALLVANTASMIKLFNQLNINLLQSMDYEIHVACNFCEGNTISLSEVRRAEKEWKSRGIHVHHIDVPRKPVPHKVVTAYKQLNELIRQERFALIHCHTPVDAALTRIVAAKSRLHLHTRIIYTAHGFHFFKGAPMKNWLFLYPVEKICSYFTDDLITINQEDYCFAKKNFASAKIHYLPGVGIDTSAFRFCQQIQENRSSIRDALGVKPGQRMILSVGELISRKNYKTAIDAIAMQNTEQVRYYICGHGMLRSKIEEYAKLRGVLDSVVFLGYRRDIPQICSCADVFLHTSYQEGLPVAVMEAMAAGVPIVASRIRGNVDLIEDGVNGFLCDPKDAKSFAEKIQTLLEEPNLVQKFRRHGLEKIQDYDKCVVAEQLRRIYCEMDACENVAEKKV